MIDLEIEGLLHRQQINGRKPHVNSQMLTKNDAAKSSHYETITIVKSVIFYLEIKVKIVKEFTAICWHNIPSQHGNTSQKCRFYVQPFGNNYKK